MQKTYSPSQAVIFLSFFLANILFFEFLFLFYPEAYNFFALEDHLVENLSALLLFISAILLLLSGIKTPKKHKTKKILLYLAAFVFFMGSGEEISWGQRIFDIATPEKLLVINDQDELNLHNINKKFFDILVDRITLVLVLLSLILSIFKVKKILHIPIPNSILIICFALTPFYHQYNHGNIEWHHLLLYLPIVYFLYFAVKQKDKLNILAASSAIILSVGFYYLHATYNANFSSDGNSANEYREYYFILCCTFYALQIKSYTQSTKVEIAKEE